MGTVTDTTCDIVAESNGAVSNVIQLGNVKVKATGTDHEGSVIDFALKPKAGATCTFTGLTNATFAFTGNLDANGLTNQGGSATGAYAKLKSVNANTPGDITSTANTAEVAVTNLANATSDGAKFSAQLIGDTTPGDYRSAVAYVVSYQ